MKNRNNCNYYASSSLMFEQEDDGWIPQTISADVSDNV